MRPARAADADGVVRLVGQLGYDVEPAAVSERLTAILAKPDQSFVVAELGGRVVGWLHVVVTQFIELEAFVVIGGLIVDRDHRRQGLGRLLMEYAERWAAERGYSVVRLWSSQSRTSAHQFYEQIGYTNIKTQYAFAKSLDRSAAGLDRFVPRVE